MRFRLRGASISAWRFPYWMSWSTETSAAFPPYSSSTKTSNHFSCIGPLALLLFARGVRRRDYMLSVWAAPSGKSMGLFKAVQSGAAVFQPSAKLSPLDLFVARIVVQGAFRDA